MKEIGGYFELELPRGKEYHNETIKLNSARNALLYILKVYHPAKVYIPAYICNSIIEPFIKINIKYEFYNIDSNFEMTQNIALLDNEKILYVNYFALKSRYITKLVEKYDDSLIVDNTQAFFEMPIKEIDTLYSPRKFFGVSDGGYLYSKNKKNMNLDRDDSYAHTTQLLGRIDKDAISFYTDYQKAESTLVNRELRLMSNLTQRILSSIDYKWVEEKRKVNFYFLHQALKNTNLIEIDDDLAFVPFVYPYMTNDKKLRQKLIENKIYIAKYWDEVLDRKETTDTEKAFVNKLIPLPIDQRYDLEDMKKVLKNLRSHQCI